MTTVSLKEHKEESLDKEKRITILISLKSFYDEEIFNLFIKDFYNADQDVSLAAIISSASIGNEAAIPHLYKIIETGTNEQKLASIATLSEIKAPSSIERLVKYFHLFEESKLKEEILGALNRIAPFADKVQELDKAILITPGQSSALLETAVLGLINAKNFNAAQGFLRTAPAKLKKLVFREILQTGNSDSAAFIESFQELTDRFASDVLGYYLCAYEIRAFNIKQNFVLESLKDPDQETVRSFLEALSEYEGTIEHPRQIFRILLIIPYIDPATEAKTGDLVERIVNIIKHRFPHLISNIGLMVATHLETVFGKIKRQYLSIKGIKVRSALLIIVFAKLLERYASAELLQKIQRYFQESLLTAPEPLIQEILEALKNAPEEDVNRFKACIPLFRTKDIKTRISISSDLSYINLARPNLIRRLNRLVRIAGNLGIKNSVKKIVEIREFARDERIGFLEETSIVTLCQLFHRKTIEDFRGILQDPTKGRSSLNGYCRGARFLPPRLLYSPLLDLITSPALSSKTQDIVIDSLQFWDLSSVKNAMSSLLSVLKSSALKQEQRHRLGDVLAYYADGSLFQTLIDLTSSEDNALVIIAVKALRGIAKKDKSILLDVLVNRLYVLLDSDDWDVQIHALLALIDLGDDYALQVFRDQLNTQEDQYTARLLLELEKQINHDMLNPILDLVKSRSPLIQKTLREVFAHLSQGPFGEEIRHLLVRHLKDLQIERSARTVQKLEQNMPGTSLLEHAKIEFKFKRENSQILTVFFIDMVGYTERTSASDTSTLIDLIKAFEDIVIPDIEHFKGNLIKKMGDGILAVFKLPLNAVTAALSIQQKIEMYNQYRVGKEKFSVRIGLNTGLVIRKDNDIYGDTVNVASRMETTAKPGEILLTSSTYEETRDFINCTPLGGIQVKGKEDAIMTYSADSMKEGVVGVQTTADSKDAARLQKAEEVSLREILVNPDYTFPSDLSTMDLKIDPRIPKVLQELFSEITSAVEEISKDYHEENAFKKYLQAKWTELIKYLKAS
jgi:class 3 adenylate cyclase/HEAT repeat protein